MYGCGIVEVYRCGCHVFSDAGDTCLRAELCQVCSHIPFCGECECVEVYGFVVERHVPGVDGEDIMAIAQRWDSDFDFEVESSKPAECRVDEVWP